MDNCAFVLSVTKYGKYAPKGELVVQRYYRSFKAAYKNMISSFKKLTFYQGDNCDWWEFRSHPSVYCIRIEPVEFEEEVD